MLVNRYWKIGDDDTTMHEVDLSEDERPYTSDIPDRPGWKEEGEVEEVPKLPADFGYRCDVTLPEAGFITAAILWFEEKHWVPKSGIIAAVVPGTLKTTDQAKKRQEKSGKIANSAVRMELHQQMLERTAPRSASACLG